MMAMLACIAEVAMSSCSVLANSVFNESKLVVGNRSATVSSEGTKISLLLASDKPDTIEDRAEFDEERLPICELTLARSPLRLLMEAVRALMVLSWSLIRLLRLLRPKMEARPMAKEVRSRMIWKRDERVDVFIVRWL